MNTQPSGTIAVFGGTGQQGGSVIDALVSRGAQVRALVRNPRSDRAQALSDRGIELRTISVDDPDSIAEALTAVDAFFFMTTPAGHSLADIEGETRQGTDLVDGAVRASVPHVVFSSVGGAERDSGIPHFESKRRVEEYLQHSGLDATVVRPVAFMENFSFLGPQIENDEIVLRMPMPDGIPLQLIAVRDIGRISAAFLVGAAEAPGGAIEIAGDARTGSQIAAAFGAHVGLPARYEALGLHVLDDNPDSQAMFRWFAETPAYQADIAAVRSIDATIWDLPTWLRSTGWAAPGTVR